MKVYWSQTISLSLIKFYMKKLHFKIYSKLFFKFNLSLLKTEKCRFVMWQLTWNTCFLDPVIPCGIPQYYKYEYLRKKVCPSRIHVIMWKIFNKFFIFISPWITMETRVTELENFKPPPFQPPKWKDVLEWNVIFFSLQCSIIENYLPLWILNIF